MEQLLKKVEAYNKVHVCILTSKTQEHRNACKLLIDNFRVLFNDNSLAEQLTEMLGAKVVN